MPYLAKGSTKQGAFYDENKTVSAWRETKAKSCILRLCHILILTHYQTMSLAKEKKKMKKPSDQRPFYPTGVSNIDPLT
jgi:hypothetical protein